MKTNLSTWSFCCFFLLSTYKCINNHNGTSMGIIIMVHILHIEKVSMYLLFISSIHHVTNDNTHLTMVITDFINYMSCLGLTITTVRH